MTEELEQLDDVSEEESLYSLDDEDEETRDAIRSYIG
jgi:hypothetical protein